jgi:hypothetical protein
VRASFTPRSTEHAYSITVTSFPEIALAHCHKRSNVETVFSMIKGKFGDAFRSKSDIGQLNEVLCKVLCHNLCVIIQAIHELGIEPKFDVKTSSIINPIFNGK